MPMQSMAQRRYLHANEPAVAEKFERHTPKGAKLPERKGSSKKEKSCRSPMRGRSGRR